MLTYSADAPCFHILGYETQSDLNFNSNHFHGWYQLDSPAVLDVICIENS